jgi:hypothetical protein
MPLAELLASRAGLAGRLPGRIDDLRGPASGVIRLPRNLAWPGMRECDVSDDRTRRAMYGMLLAKGRRHDIERLVNPALLSQDWPLIRNVLDPRLSRRCERQFGLGHPAGTGHDAQAPAESPAPAPGPATAEGGATGARR